MRVPAVSATAVRSRPGAPLGLAVAGLLFVLGCSTPSADQLRPRATGDAATPVLTVTGDLPRMGRLNVAELEALGASDITWEHNGVVHGVRGVPVEAVLRHFGWDIGPGGREAGPAERRSGMRCAILAKCADGYRTTFSCAELTAENGPTSAFVVWQENGAPLDTQTGPLRLVTPTDKQGARSVRQLRELHVVDLGR